MNIRSLRCEYLEAPLAIDTPQPRLSWIPPFDQGAWQVIVTSQGEVVWDSGKVVSDSSMIPYAGIVLQALCIYEWKVKVWSRDGRESEWSEPSEWGMGPAGPGWSHEVWQLDPIPEINARWIGTPAESVWQENDSPASPMLRKEFHAEKGISRAILYTSALGLYEAYLNGSRVGHGQLAPEWTDYHSMAQYQAHDVTRKLQVGPNVLGAILGPGWYAGRIGMSQVFANTLRGVYGRRMAFIALLHVQYADGKIQTIVTGPDWQCTLDGPIRGSDLLDGEQYDARRQCSGWCEAGYDSDAWSTAETMMGPQLVAQRNESIQITRRMSARTINEVSPNTWVVDFGQNLVGWCCLKIHNAQPGAQITLRHAEALQSDGTMYMENMRGASPVDRYMARGDDSEVYEPRFTYHGFRFAEITGLFQPPALEDIEACVVHSAMRDTGEFECSDDMGNRIMRAVQWTHRNNMHGIPTDCPQRDERLGWMGDAQVFAQTAIFNMDMAAFFTKWLADVRGAQAQDGRFPDIAPHPYDPNQRFSGNPGWSDAGLTIPWAMYVNYGDRSILAEQYDAAKRYIDWCTRNNPDRIWNNRSQLTPLWYGDWLNADTLKDLPNWPATGGEVAREIYSTAFYAHSTQLLSRMAGVLGYNEDQGRYNELAGEIRKAFNDSFVSPDGRIQGDTQSGYALALLFDLLPDSLRRRAAQRMKDALATYGGALSTGFHSTVRLMLELSRYGYHEEAYALLMRKTMPSWGYMVENGGTTIWERWDGWVEGRGFQNPGMNSFCHYAIGAVGEWIYRVVGGLNPDESAPGWKHFHVRPVPGGGLTFARTTYQSIRGTIQSQWRIENDNFVLDVTVPPNTTATIQLPDSSEYQAISGEHSFSCPSIG